MSVFNRVLVLGSNGMLGSHVAEVCRGNAPLEVILSSGERFYSSHQLVEYVSEYRPSAVVNCIGYLGQDPALHYLVNGCLPRAVTDACERIGALCVLMSTDAVYPKTRERKWFPRDRPKPATPYEVAKAFGEDPRAYVIRASFIGVSPKGVGLYHRLTNGEAYRDRRWNGVTALTLARRIVQVVTQNAGTCRRAVEHVHSPNVVRISEIAKMVGSSSNCLGVESEARLLDGGVPLPVLSEQLREYQELLGCDAGIKWG